MIEDIIKAIKMLCICIVLIGGVYNFFLHMIGAICFPSSSKGSLIYDTNNKLKGSYLLGQSFTNDILFRGRLVAESDLEATTPIYDEQFIYDIRNSIKNLKDEFYDMLPIEMATFSGSGLDPFITVSAAKLQVKRIADNRNIETKLLEELIEKLREKPLKPFFKYEKINVTKLNVALNNLETTIFYKQTLSFRKK